MIAAKGLWEYHEKFPGSLRADLPGLYLNESPGSPGGYF